MTDTSNVGVATLDWQHRVVAEKDELQGKIVKLTTFLTANQATLQKHISTALIAQLDAMCAYSDTLSLRIRMFNLVVTDKEAEDFEYPITSVSDMGNAILNWHNKVMQDIKHLQSIPEFTEVKLNGLEGETPNEITIILTGAALAGFKAGAIAAEAITMQLPFSKNTVDPLATQDPTETEVA